MATERLQVILDMETGQYRREARRAADSTKEVGSAVDGTSRKTGGLTSRFGAARGAALRFAAVGVPLLIGLTKGIEAIRDMNIEAEAIENRFDTVFGDRAADVRAWSNEVNERFGTSEEAVRDLANGIGDLLVPLGFTRDEAADLSQEALTLSNALSEWSGGSISVADASERVRKALLGEREGLKELGVSVLQSEVNARLLANGQDGLTGAEKARAQALATLNIIQDRSTDALDAYERGTNTALISQKKLQAAQEDSARALADILAPEVEFITELSEEAAVAGGEMVEWLRDLRGESEDTADNQQSLIESGIELIATYGPEGLSKTVSELITNWFDYKDATEESAEATAAAIPISAGYAAGLEVVARDADDAAGSVKAVTQAIKDRQTAERLATDPVFRLREANDKLNEAYSERVRLEADGAPKREVLDALDDELRARQDLAFAQENFNDQADTTFSDLETYAALLNIQPDLWEAWKTQILGVNDALRGVPTPGTLPQPDLTFPAGGPQPLASGGFMDADRPYFTGERGVELVIPNVPSYIIPNHQLAGITSSGGDTINQTVTLQSSGNVARDAQVASIMLANRSIVRGGLKGGAR